MQYSTETVVKIVKATCVLHNFLCDRNLDVANIYTRLNPEMLEYLSANGTVVNLQHLPGYRSIEEAQRIGRVFTTYFNVWLADLLGRTCTYKEELNVPRDLCTGDS